jgi:hypothetical protein
MIIRREFALGVPGLQEGLSSIAGLIADGMRDGRILTWARLAMWEASLPVNASPTEIALAIYRKQRADMVFAQDPICTELYMSAVKLLCLDPAGECIRGGDCDDNVIVLASALMSVGVPVRLLVRSYPRMDQLHLMIQYDADPMKRGNWTCFDATSPTGACFGGYDTEMVTSLEVVPMVEQQPPQLMILGRPPVRPKGLFGMFGAPPAASVSTVQLTDGASTIKLAPGTSLEITLPPGAQWNGLLVSGGIAVSGAATVGSAPTQGTNPASLVYNGGGASVTASWWAPESSAYPLLVVHSSTITISDASTSTSSSSSTTSTTTTTATLPQDQAAAWASLLTEAKTRLDASLVRLNSYTNQLVAVREDLGMPSVDPPPPTGETPTTGAGLSPLDIYGTQGYAWTSDAQSAQAKLVQTGSFLSGVLGDALAGTRALYWNNGDLFVGSLAGDPYGVLLKPLGGAGSPVFPSYVDVQSGNTTGQVGFGLGPILIGIGIVVASLAAVYAVVKIVDYLASAHRDDAVGKIAAAQQQLVAEGKQTPEQAAAFMKASADLVSAPPASASSGISVGWLVAAAVGGALAGVVGAEFVPKLLRAHLSFAPA